MKDCYALFDIPYRKGELKAIGSSGREYILKSGDPASAKIRLDDREYDGYVFTRISLFDKDGVRIMAEGQEYDCQREGMELIAAASENTCHDHGFAHPKICLYGAGGFAVYRKRE